MMWIIPKGLTFNYEEFRSIKNLLLALPARLRRLHRLHRPRVQREQYKQYKQHTPRIKQISRLNRTQLEALLSPKRKEVYHVNTNFNGEVSQSN